MMYKLNGEDIDVYVVIRGYISRDVILQNYTQDKVKLCGCFKSLCTAHKKRKEIIKIIEFLGGEKQTTNPPTRR